MAAALDDIMLSATFFEMIHRALCEDAESIVAGWSEKDFITPSVDIAAAEYALRTYCSRRGLRQPGFTWHASGRTARDYVYARWKHQPRPTYFSSLSIAPVLDAAWFAGGMRPPIRTGMNNIALITDSEDWLLATVKSRPEKRGEELLNLLSTECEAVRRGAHPDGAAVGANLCEHPFRIWKPLMDAFGAGLYFFWIADGEAICVERPSLSILEGVLHGTDGPAVRYKDGEEHFFWRGVEIYDWVIRSPDLLTADRIAAESDPARKKAMLERLKHR
jgi:hypothetical protein